MVEGSHEVSNLRKVRRGERRGGLQPVGRMIGSEVQNTTNLQHTDTHDLVGVLHIED